MKVLSPFGPKIAIIKIPKNIVNKINQEVDKILGDKKKLKKSDYSKKLVGQVKPVSYTHLTLPTTPYV